MEETKLTKLITNQYIIGKTIQANNTTTIKDPYMVIPDPMGIQMFAYDEAIIGKKLEMITVDNSNVMYCTEVGQDLRNTYLTSLSGLEVDETKKLII